MLSGKRAARREARLMVNEKVDAALKASRSLIGGEYRRHSRQRSGSWHKEVLEADSG